MQNRTLSNCAYTYKKELDLENCLCKGYRNSGTKTSLKSPKFCPVQRVHRKVQHQLDLGKSVFDIAKEQQLKSNTLSKAIRAGHLHQPLKKKRTLMPSSSQAAKAIAVS